MSNDQPASTVTPRFNVDERDVQHFSSTAKFWWDPEGPWRILHKYNSIRVPFIRDCLTTPGKIDIHKTCDPNALKGLNILEVGCGAGILSEALAELGANVVGIDPSTDLIETANDHISGQTNLKYVCELVEEHVEKNREKYDVVVASEVLEHIVDKTAFLKPCVEALKPGGSIFVTTFNRTWISWFCAILFLEYVIELIPVRTHIWKQFISPSDVEEILKKNNCRKVHLQGFGYDIFRKLHCLWSNTYCSYGLHAVKEFESNDESSSIRSDSPVGSKHLRHDDNPNKKDE